MPKPNFILFILSILVIVIEFSIFFFNREYFNNLYKLAHFFIFAIAFLVVIWSLIYIIFK
jgi:hypothetical protein